MYLNLIKLLRKTLRLSALTWHCFESQDWLRQSAEAATAHWDKHDYPFVWGNAAVIGSGASLEIVADPSVR